MTRIIAGAARGRRLSVPTSGTRPTADRVREALFSAVGAQLVSWAGRRVLDLYAGSGALGLEALSRGAAHALLVEHDRRAVQVLEANVETVGLPGAVVVGRDVRQVLATCPSAAYDVVLADPPYDLPDAGLTAVLTTLADRGWLAPGALVVVERGRRPARPGPRPGPGVRRGGGPGLLPPLPWPEGYQPGWTRTYGDTLLHAGTYRGVGPGP